MLRLFPALLLSLCVAAPSLADTITTTGTFDEIFGGGAFWSSSSPDPGSFFLDEGEITGLEKFDPALGTLNSVTIEADFEYEWEIFIMAGEVLDESLEHFAEVEAFFDLGFGYTETGTSIDTLVSVIEGGFASCSEGPFGPPCEDGIGGFTDFGASALIDSPIGDLDLGDFVGTGPGEVLDTISLNVFIPIGPPFFIDNLDEATAELFYSIFGLDGELPSVTLTYDYTPIPEPGTFALFGLGLAALAARRR